MPSKRSRGDRNNNPGNIRRSFDKWKGLSDAQLDNEFFQFTAPCWGVRALAKILRTYQNKHGLRTVRGIINRWAPPVENDTNSYAKAVAKACGVQADDEVDVNVLLPQLVQAIIHHENGYHPYSANDLAEWVRLP